MGLYNLNPGAMGWTDSSESSVDVNGALDGACSTMFKNGPRNDVYGLTVFVASQNTV